MWEPDLTAQIVADVASRRSTLVLASRGCRKWRRPVLGLRWRRAAVMGVGCEEDGSCDWLNRRRDAGVADFRARLAELEVTGWLPWEVLGRTTIDVVAGGS